MRTNRLALAAAAIALATAMVPGTAQANHSWNNYHWARTANPFNLKLGDNVDSNWDSYLATTSSDWTQSTVLNTAIVPGSTTGKRCAATTGRVEVCNAAYGQRGWLGIASINISGSHITQGTVKVNDTYYSTAKYNTPAWRNLVMCQEVGHTLGLDHQDENFDNTPLGTCMDYSNDPVPNQHPNQHDYNQLVAIYSHLDSTTTVGQAAPTGSGRATGNSPKSWGDQVEGSRARGHSTYVRNDGNGSYIITFVTWA